MREYGGRERTLFAIATARGEPIRQEDLFYAKENNGRASQAWELLDAATQNPNLTPEVKSAIMAADVLMGNDRDCFAWIKANRDPNAPAGGRGDRESRRRRGGSSAS